MLSDEENLNGAIGINVLGPGNRENGRWDDVVPLPARLDSAGFTGRPEGLVASSKKRIANCRKSKDPNFGSSTFSG
jgi:hypothetical protein